MFNDPLLGMDLYGLEFSENLKQGSIGLMHSAGNFGIDAFRMGTSLTFTLGMPLSLGWHLITGKGSLSEEWQEHLKWQSSFNLKAQDLMQRVLPGDMNSSWYQGSKWGGGVALEAGVLAATAGSLVYKLGVKGVEFGTWGIQRALTTKIVRQSFSLGKGAENINAGISLTKKLSQLEKAQLTTRVRILSDGRIRYYGKKIPARNVGITRSASRVSEYNPLTGQTRSWHECYDQNGNVIRVHPKQINGQDVISSHYPLIGEEIR